MPARFAAFSHKFVRLQRQKSPWYVVSVTNTQRLLGSGGCGLVGFDGLSGVGPGLEAALGKHSQSEIEKPSTQSWVPAWPVAQRHKLYCPLMHYAGSEAAQPKIDRVRKRRPNVARMTHSFSKDRLD